WSDTPGPGPSRRIRQRRCSEKIVSSHAPPGFLPVFATEVGDAPIALEELVRNLEHGEEQAAFRPGPRLVAAPRRAPDELPGLADSFPAMQFALQDVGLLD